MQKNKIPLRQYVSVLGITIAAFIFNTSEFMPIGLLSDISEAFQLTEAGTGIMITAYAWVVAVLSLPLMLLVTKIELKKLLIATITLFCIGQILSGAAITFSMLLIARILRPFHFLVDCSTDSGAACIQRTSVCSVEHGSDRHVCCHDFWVAAGTNDWPVFGMAHDFYNNCRCGIPDDDILVFCISSSYQQGYVFCCRTAEFIEKSGSRRHLCIDCFDVYGVLYRIQLYRTVFIASSALV